MLGLILATVEDPTDYENLQTLYHEAQHWVKKLYLYQNELDVMEEQLIRRCDDPTVEAEEACDLLNQVRELESESLQKDLQVYLKRYRGAKTLEEDFGDLVLREHRVVQAKMKRLKNALEFVRMEFRLLMGATPHH